MNKNNNLTLQALMILLETFEVGKQSKSRTWKAFITLSTNKKPKKQRLIVHMSHPTVLKDLTKLKVLRRHFVT